MLSTFLPFCLRRNGCSIRKNRPTVRFSKSEQNLDERRFSSAAVSDQCDLFALFTRKQISCRTFFSPYPKSTCSIEISEIVLLSAAMDSWFLSFDTSPFCSQKSKNPSMYPAYSPALPAICSNSTDSAYRMMCVPFKSAAKSSSPIVFFQKKQYPRYAIIKQSINRKSLPISRPNAIGKIRRFHCFVCSAFCEKLS